MPYIPIDTECNELIPSICENAIVPVMDFSFVCNGCMPRPHGDCLDELLIPDICDIECS